MTNESVDDDLAEQIARSMGWDEREELDEYLLPEWLIEWLAEEHDRRPPEE